MIDKHKAETCQWNMLVKGVYLFGTPYCCTASTPSLSGLLFPKSVEQNCSEKNRCPKNIDGLVLNMCTMILAMTNYMPKVGRADMTNSVCRRRMILNCCNRSIAENPTEGFDQELISIEEKHSLIACALFTASMHKHPPCSIRIATLSLFGSFVNTMTAGMVEREQQDATYLSMEEILDLMVATRVLAMRAGLDMDMMVVCFFAFSPALVSKCDRTNVSYLPGILIDPSIVFTHNYKSVIEEIVEITSGPEAAKHWFGGAAIDIDWDSVPSRVIKKEIKLKYF